MKKNIIISLCIFLFSCSLNKGNIMVDYTNNMIMNKHYDNIISNDNKSFLLCYNNSEEIRNPNALLHYIVFDTENNVVFYADSLVNASISWYNRTIVKIIKQKAYIVKPNDNSKWSYYYSLIKKKNVDIGTTNLK